MGYHEHTTSREGSFSERLQAAISRAGAPLCVGLDPVPERLPKHLGVGPEACRRFCMELIETLRESVAAFKPNAAFFEAYGAAGWEILEELRSAIGPDWMLILDAKRGDIGSSNEAYARSAFEQIQADAITVQPYLGGSELAPFLRDSRRGVFALCVTSNQGAEEIQNLEVNGEPLYIKVARQAREWSEAANVGLVVGTTKRKELQAVLKVAPDLPLLMPGSGTQGGSLNVIKDLKHAGAIGILNFSRSVIYASDGKDFAQAALDEVMQLKQRLSGEL